MIDEALARIRALVSGLPETTETVDDAGHPTWSAGRRPYVVLHESAVVVRTSLDVYRELLPRQGFDPTPT